MTAIGAAGIPQFTPNFSDSEGKISEISAMDFLQILVTELMHQDPLDPMDNAALVEQISAIRNLESISRMTEMNKQLLFSSNLSSASALIGRIVEGGSTSGEHIIGVVESVIVDDGQVLLVTQQGFIPVENVLGVTEANEAENTEG